MALQKSHHPDIPLLEAYNETLIAGGVAEGQEKTGKVPEGRLAELPSGPK